MNASARSLLEEEEVAGEGGRRRWREGETRKEQMEEEDITVPSFPRPANSFQGSRTLPTEPNSKVIAPIPASAGPPLSSLNEKSLLSSAKIQKRLINL